MRHIDHASLSFIIPKSYDHNAINAVDVLHQKTNLFVAMPDEVINKSYRYLTMVFCQIFRLLLIFSLMGSCVAWGNLSKQTENPIQGTAPYLLFKFENGETRKVLNSDDLFYMAFYDGNELKMYDKFNNFSSEENPIIVPASVKSLKEILLPVPVDANINQDFVDQQEIDFDTLAKKWGVDEDNDINFSGTGKLLGNITDQNGYVLERNGRFSACDSEYHRVTLSFYDKTSAIFTQYGLPNKTDFKLQNISFFIKHKKEPTACWVQPNLLYNGGPNNRNKYNGPEKQWNFQKGFLPQDIDNPSSNFPTTGMKGQWFNLAVIETNINDIRYIKYPNNSDLKLSISNSGNNVVKIELDGPDWDSASQSLKVFEPTTFTIFADSNYNTKLYTFEINQWFIVKPTQNHDDKGVTYDKARQYCNNIGYRMPYIKDLTNANSPLSVGLPGQPNNYQRSIGGGLLAEWGRMNDAVYENKVTLMKFWVNKQNAPVDESTKYSVYTSDGGILGSVTSSDTAQTICVSP